MVEQWPGDSPQAWIDDIGHAIAERYRRIEDALRETLERLAGQHVEAPRDTLARHRAIQDLREQAERLVETVNPDELARWATAEAAMGASAEIARQLLSFPAYAAQGSSLTAGGAYAVAAVELDLRDALRALNARILRAPVDAYQAMTSKHIGSVLSGITTQQALHRRILDEYIADGITGFIDKSGRRWTIGAYSEMATRSAAARAWRDQSIASMTAADIHTFTPVVGNSACSPCAAWIGKIVTDGGPTGDVVVRHAITGEPTTLHVDGTIQEAQASGWGHPNCRCVWVPGLPGGPDPSKYSTWDKQKERDREKLRELERDVRQAKRDGDPDEIGEAQAALRDHIDETGINRRGYREQLPFADGGDANPRGRTKPTPTRSPWTDRSHLSWEQRRRDLGIDFKGDKAVKNHEIRFLERFTMDLKQRVEWIPRPTDRRPSNDFRWLNLDGIPVEMKRREPNAVATGKVSDYVAFRRAFGHAAERAARHPLHPVTKENFIADMEDRTLTPELRAEFAGINRDIIRFNLGYPPVKRLWVMHRDGFEEINLL